MHIGRQFTGTEIEQDCPCPTAPCGLVYEAHADPTCTEHHMDHAPTIRQGHPSGRCPGPRREAKPAPARLLMATTRSHTDSRPTRKEGHP